MRYLSFKLSMPGCPSWNGKWSGEGRNYVIVRDFSKKSDNIANDILKNGDYGYSWSDGWYASINVSEVTSKEKRQLKKNSNGFCGYDWMIDSIIKNGKITSQ